VTDIRAITFDLWDTLVHDDSDEPRRKALGLRSKRDERRHLIWRALDAIEPIDLETVSLAYDVADAGFNLVWRENWINWRLEQRLRVVLNGLARTLPDPIFEEVLTATAAMEVDVPPDPIEGIEEALAELSGRYKLAVVSDSIVTPGSGLKDILEGHGLARYFEAFAFSDQVGHSKPHRSMFDCACQQLGVDITEIVHIGDRDHNDVKGAQALGAKAVLFTATRSADRDTTSADGICDHHRDLPSVIAQLASN
jgi:putative hydrolase of the HAD superfamily